MSAGSPEQVHALIAEAFGRGDLDAFVELHEEEAVTLIPPDGRRVKGHDEIRDAARPIVALRPELTTTVVMKLHNGDLALTQARWSLSGVDPAGEVVEFAGLGSVVSRRQPDGSWRIVMENPMRPV